LIAVKVKEASRPQTAHVNLRQGVSMTYRSILVGVDSSAGARRRIAAAVTVAGRFHSSLTGVFPGSSRIPAYLIGDAFAVPPIDNIEQAMKERGRQIAAASAAARADFDRAAREAGVTGHWFDIDGASDEELVSCARRHDLTVLPSRLTSAPDGGVMSAEHVAMTSGGPVLVVPQAGYPVDFGRRVLVAWKETREAARALKDALPFLQTAEEVQFLTVTDEAQPAEDEMLQRYLRQHECKPARLIVDSDGGSPSGQIIRRHIDMMGADLVVLGLYGHSRLREFVLGGVSRDLLTALTMPLLVSH
jgi:nucleotide-binding universal stress UspA family protein